MNIPPKTCPECDAPGKPDKGCPNCYDYACGSANDCHCSFPTGGFRRSAACVQIVKVNGKWCNE